MKAVKFFIPLILLIFGCSESSLSTEEIKQQIYQKKQQILSILTNLEQNATSEENFTQQSLWENYPDINRMDWIFAQDEIDASFRRWYLNNKTISDEIRSCIINKKIRRGMIKGEVRASWGSPNDINSTVGNWGTHEQWIYGGYDSITQIYTKATYVYFENGILTSWQD